jgi:hypothetical protein
MNKYPRRDAITAGRKRIILNKFCLQQIETTRAHRR